MGSPGRMVSSIFKAPMKLFKAVTKSVKKVTGKGKKKKTAQRVLAKTATDVTQPARQAASILGGGARATLLTGASGVEEQVNRARTTLGA